MYHGMINIYKEKGYTSSDVVAKLRGILHMKKIGHTGTLDPDAEGVLPVCLGNGTKLCELIADRDKEYDAVMRLGVVTDTQDMSGRILSETDADEVRAKVTGERLKEVIRAYTGEISQIPPMYSAIKVGGKRLYELARQGRTVERSPRPVQIYSLDIQWIELPLIAIHVRCSKGTYIRTLCHDIGQSLGTGAAMESLVRTRVGSFRLEDAIRLGEAEAIMHSDDPERILTYIMPVDSFFKDSAPEIVVLRDGLKYLLNGNPLSKRVTRASETNMANQQLVRVYDEEGKFYALYRYDKEKDRYTSYKMFLS